MTTENTHTGIVLEIQQTDMRYEIIISEQNLISFVKIPVLNVGQRLTKDCKSIFQFYYANK